MCAPECVVKLGSSQPVTSSYCDSPLVFPKRGSFFFLRESTPLLSALVFNRADRSVFVPKVRGNAYVHARQGRIGFRSFFSCGVFGKLNEHGSATGEPPSTIVCLRIQPLRDLSIVREIKSRILAIESENYGVAMVIGDEETVLQKLLPGAAERLQPTEMYCAQPRSWNDLIHFKVFLVWAFFFWRF